jgi:hypothetical protein
LSRPFELKRFLQQTPLALIVAYLSKNERDLGIKFSDDTSCDVSTIAAAISELPEVPRLKAASDFIEIEAIASERGLQALAEEADWHIGNKPAEFGADRDLRQRLSAMESDHERAMWIFLNRPTFWHGTMRFFQADDLGPSQWHKRRDLHKVHARVNEKAGLALGYAIGTHFHEAHARGRLCAVEIFRRGELDYFFCFGQGASEAPHAWVDGILSRQPLHRARDVIFIYSKDEGSLDTYARGGSREVSALEAIFAEVILGQPNLPPAPKDRRAYQLDALKSPDFSFRYDPQSEIDAVVIRSMRFSRNIGQRPHIFVQADYASDPRSIYQEMTELGDALEDRHVTQAEIAVHFTPTPTRLNRYVKGFLTYPNRCTFRYDGLDLVARQMFKDSGLELQEPLS